MQSFVELHLDTDDTDGAAARSRLSEALLAAAQYASNKRDRQPLRSSDPDTTRYGWGQPGGTARDCRAPRPEHPPKPRRRAATGGQARAQPHALDEPPRHPEARKYPQRKGYPLRWQS